MINFYKGLEENYSSEQHSEGIYQCTDTGNTYVFGVLNEDEGGVQIDALPQNIITTIDSATAGDASVQFNVRKSVKNTENGQYDTEVLDKQIQIAAATTGMAGVMSATDKTNLDNLVNNTAGYVTDDTIANSTTFGLVKTSGEADESNGQNYDLKGTGDVPHVSIPVATTETDGLMSAEDKTALDKVSNIQPEDIFAYGVEWDITVADPVLTRIGNMQLHKTLPIQSAFKGCIYANGEVQYYLDPDDWSKKEDGTGSVRNGEDGIVCVEIPEFYYKSEVDGNKGRMWVSTIQIDSTWHKQEALYVDAYRATMVRNNSSLSSASGYLTSFTNNDIVSIVNTDTAFRGGTNSTTYDTYLSTDQFRTLLGKPVTNQGRTNMRNYMGNAIDSNQRLMSYEEYKNIFYWLYVIEYANFNSQAAYNAELTSEGYHQGGLGEGLTTGNWNNWTSYNGNNPITPCGYGDNLGNRTGIKDITVDMNGSITFHMPRWRGFDNPFGDIWTNLDGILIDTPLTGASDPNVTPTCYIITNPNNYTDSLDSVEDVADRIYTLPHNEGYIKRQHTNQNGDIAVAELGGSATTYICDYYYVNYGNTPKTLLVGGRLDDGSNAGLGGFGCSYRVAHARTGVGFRTVRPKN